MKLITIACVNLLLLAKAAKQYVATFAEANSGVVGTVTVDMGQLVIDLDLSATILSDEGFAGVSFADCTAGGLSYHIHEKWDLSSSDDIRGSDCGATNTAGHWDPWQACGKASGNDYCGDGTNLTCIPTSAYNPDFSADPFSAEVGDWSAKYSKLELTTENTVSLDQSSFYEVIPSELAGRSVVFHCSNDAGTRAFCAPFLEGADAASATVPDQATEGAVIAEFDGLGDGSMIMLSSDGTIDVNVDGGDVAAGITACTQYAYGIFEPGTLTAAAVSDGCSGVTEQYDPTAQCPPFSGNSYCMDMQLCGDTSQAAYADRCDFSADRYSCAPGDLSARDSSLLTVSGTYTTTIDGPNTLIPPVGSLVGKVLGIYCPYEDGDTDITFLACAPIEAYTATPGTTDSATSISFVAAIVASFIALLF